MRSSSEEASEGHVEHSHDHAEEQQWGGEQAEQAPLVAPGAEEQQWGGDQAELAAPAAPAAPAWRGHAGMGFGGTPPQEVPPEPVQPIAPAVAAAPSYSMFGAWRPLPTVVP